ncbi:MAG TPA: hypothetical protein VGZ73_32110 [Bryobacteraceae bacterium]|nr:hypothetical protein [Bryobacteraceae bacterium]
MKDPLAPLLAIAHQGMPLTARDGQTFIRLGAPSGGFYIFPIRSRAYRDWFLHTFYAEYDTLPTSRAFHAILNHLEAEANQNGPEDRFAVWRRVGTRGPGHILLDLSDNQCQFVEITSTGWKTTAVDGTHFQTSCSTISLPEPMPRAAQAPSTLGSPAPGPWPPAPIALDTLRSFLNLRSRADWLRCVAWLLSTLRPKGSFPVLVLQGPPGSGKSLAAVILRSLIDPCTSPLTPIPSSVRDLLTLARHNWVLGFDHISDLSPQLTDALCRLSSGLGATLRETPSHSTEPLQQYFKRPVLLTVTERWSCPSDLAERALIVDFPPFPPSETESPDYPHPGPRTELSLLKAFEEAWPRILADLCSAASIALSRIDQFELPSAGPGREARCASALAWAMAASPALGCTEEEMQQAFALPRSPSRSAEHPIVEAVRNLLAQRGRWTGSATELRDLLQPLVSSRKPGSSKTPRVSKSPRGISQQLKNSTLTLADIGIEFRFKRLGKGRRAIELRDDLGDANCQEDRRFASPDPKPPPQTTEKEQPTKSSSKK